MKSLRAWILMALAVTLLLALAVSLAISNYVLRAHLYPVFEAMDELELESARGALERGGKPALAAYMQHLDRVFGTKHYLLDAAGTDVSSGDNLSVLLPSSPDIHLSRVTAHGRLIVTHETADRRYWFVAVDPRQRDRWTFLPYYLLVIGVTGVTYWLIAVGILGPIQEIAIGMGRFGKGDLAVRLRTKRRDEIGGLARSFDEMAERIQTLLASERRLLTDISHELRSPLARLTLALRLAETSPNGQDQFERVRRELTRITLLVSELTELTRAEGEPTARSSRAVRLQEVVEETLRDCYFEAQYRGCRLAIEGSLCCAVCGDRELLRRAVENVLRNAIRYSPEQGTIECCIRESSTVASIIVRDYGPGVPEEKLMQIFEPFFRVDEARDAESGGIGLGLSIAKRALQVHRGTIQAENAHPGLRVFIAIPLD